MNDEHQSDAVADLNDLGQLAAAVGHHVINTFAAIVSNAEVLRGGPEATRSIDPVTIAETIIRSALDASGIARRLIDYSRTATVPGEARVALDRLAEAVVAREQERADGRVAWSLELTAVPDIRGNEAQLLMMLGHLLTNAREALGPAGGSIIVSTSRDERGRVALEVRDTGRGMSAHVQEHAVEPFFTTKPGHLGVGLSIANGIWRRHKGTLAVRSQLGEGTCARLCIDPIPQDER